MAGKRRIETDIIANDKSSQVFNQVGINAQRMASRINTGMESLNRGLHKYNTAMKSFNWYTQMALAGAGYAVYKFTTDAAKQFAEFEKQHGKTMGAIVSNYDRSIAAQQKFMADQKKIREDAIKLGTVGPNGKGTLFSPVQVSSAQTALAKAGVKAGDINTVTSSVMKFAGGNDLDMEQASDYAVNMAKMFKIPADKWEEMLDKVTRTADVSTIDVPDIFESIKYAGPIAAGLKRSMDEVLAMVAIMGNVGIKGSMAGTGIQAFYTRILSPIGKSEASLKTAPSEYSENVLKSFIAETTTPDGKMKSGVDITEMLNTAMESLNDKEQAWFAQKLFSMFQMKAGFVMAQNGGDVMQGVIDDIIQNGPGANNRKWDIMLATSWGKRTAAANAYLGTKTDVGERLSPLSNAIADELFKALTDTKNYKIDFGNLKKSLRQASELISQKYGEQMGDLVFGGGMFGMNAGRVIGANAPLLEGVGISTFKLLSGDLPGSLSTMYESVGKVNENIEKLPPDLQNMARETRNVITALTALVTANFAARIIETITTVWKFTIGRIGTKDILDTVSKSAVATMNVTAANVIINGKAGVGGTGGKTVTGGKEGDTTVAGAPTTAPKSSRLKNGLIKGVGAYSILEMLGINDMILDKMGVKAGTSARDTIDVGRKGLDTGLTAYWLDSLLFGGKGATAVGGALKGMAAASGMGAGMLALPAGIGGSVLMGEYLKNKAGRNLANQMRWTQEEGGIWGWNPDGKGIVTLDSQSLERLRTTSSSISNAPTHVQFSPTIDVKVFTDQNGNVKSTIVDSGNIDNAWRLTGFRFGR